MFKIIDDVIPKPIFNRIKSLVIDNPFFNFTATKTAVFNDRVSSFATEPKTEWESQYFGLPLVMALANINLEIENLFRIRFGILHRDIKQIINTPHIDAPNRRHFVGLYYLNDTDGSTKIWKQKHTNFDTEPKSYTIEDVDLQQEIFPKSNRMVLFNGEHYHSSTLPTKTQLRYVINYNFTYKSIDPTHL